MFSSGRQGAGGPLLSLGEMLDDLTAEEAVADETKAEELEKIKPSEQGQTQRQAVKFEDLVAAPETLHMLFERTFNQLNVALAHTGHTWTGLTQQLCIALAVADRVVESVKSPLASLQGEVGTLKQQVARGSASIDKLKDITQQR
eukprot:jgi/Mesen1/7809/ME000413S07066